MNTSNRHRLVNYQPILTIVSIPKPQREAGSIGTSRVEIDAQTTKLEEQMCPLSAICCNKLKSDTPPLGVTPFNLHDIKNPRYTNRRGPLRQKSYIEMVGHNPSVTYVE